MRNGDASRYWKGVAVNKGLMRLLSEGAFFIAGTFWSTSERSVMSGLRKQISALQFRARFMMGTVQAI